MNHFADVETTTLHAPFADALLSEASCEAVLIESAGPSEPVGSTGLDRTETERRGSVVLFRVGRAYVAEVVGVEGETRTLGLAPVDAESYLDRVDGDEDWTVLTVEGSLSAGRRNATGARETEVERDSAER